MSLLILSLPCARQQADRARSKEAGFDHHLVKPVSAADIIAILKRNPQRVIQWRV